MSFESERFSPEEAKNYRHSPQLANLLRVFVANKLHPYCPIYDFGCGDGYYLDSLARFGWKGPLIGFEGAQRVPRPLHKIIVHPTDVAKPLYAGPAGFVMSIEVGEHVHWGRVPMFLKNLTDHAEKYVLLTWAVRGQKGRRHVSCLDEYEVVGIMKARGFAFLKDDSQKWREAAGEDLPWFKNSIYLFKR